MRLKTYSTDKCTNTLAKTYTDGLVCKYGSTVIIN